MAFTRPNSTFGKRSEHDEVTHQSDAMNRGEMDDHAGVKKTLDTFRKKYKFQSAIKNGRPSVVPAYKWKNTQNTEAGSDRPARAFQSLDPQKKARVSKGGNQEMPIVTRGEHGDHLLAGNTRATRNAMQGKPTTVLKIRESLQSFKNFLLERPRTREQAEKLLNYLGTKKRFDSGVLPQPHFIKTIAPHSSEQDTKDIYTHKLKYKTTEQVPIHQIKTIQKSVALSKVQEMIHRKKKKDPKAVVLVHHNGEHHMIDGNHRYTTSRLRGDTHVKADIYHLNTHKTVEKWGGAHKVLQMK